MSDATGIVASLTGRVLHPARLLDTRMGTPLARVLIEVDGCPGEPAEVVQALMLGHGVRKLITRFSPGDRLAIQGRLQLSRWADQDGLMKARMQIRVARCEVMRADDAAPGGGTPQ